MVGEDVQVGTDVPFDCNIWLEVPAAVNPVVLDADCQGISPAAPPAIFVDAVAVGTVPVTENVTAPVEPDTEIFVPATALVTPVFDNVTVPPNATGDPDTPKPVPPVTVIELFVNALFGIPVKFVPVKVGVVVNAGIADADPCNTPAAPAID